MQRCVNEWANVYIVTMDGYMLFEQTTYNEKTTTMTTTIKQKQTNKQNPHTWTVIIIVVRKQRTGATASLDPCKVSYIANCSRSLPPTTWYNKVIKTGAENLGHGEWIIFRGPVGCSSVGRASDRHAAAAGSIPRRSKGFLSQSFCIADSLPVSAHSRVQSHTLIFVRTLKIPLSMLEFGGL